jgi:hypothetical protein
VIRFEAFPKNRGSGNGLTELYSLKEQPIQIRYTSFGAFPIAKVVETDSNPTANFFTVQEEPGQFYTGCTNTAQD